MKSRVIYLSNVKAESVGAEQRHASDSDTGIEQRGPRSRRSQGNPGMRVITRLIKIAMINLIGITISTAGLLITLGGVYTLFQPTFGWFLIAAGTISFAWLIIGAAVSSWLEDVIKNR